MDSPKITYKYYSNPAFCAQSEVVYTQQTPCVSPRIAISPNSKKNRSENKRIPPLGANSPRKILPHQEYRSQIGNQRLKTDISDNPLRNVYSKNDGPLKYVNDELPPKPGPKPGKQNTANLERRQSLKRVTRIRQNANYQTGKNNKETLEMYQVGNSKSEDDFDSNIEEETVMDIRTSKHRYAEIQDDYDEYSPSKKRIIETDPEEYNVDTPEPDEIKEVPSEIIRSVNGKVHRYAIIPSDEDDDIVEDFINIPRQEAHSPPTFFISSPGMSRKSLEATQRLHELLTTPKKELRRVGISSPMKSCISSPSLRSQMSSQNGKMMLTNDIIITPSKKHVSSTPKQSIAPSKSCANLASPPLPRRNTNLNSSMSPRVQQKLNYDQLSPRSHGGANFYAREKSFDRTRDLNQSYELDASKEFERDFRMRDNKQNLFTARSTAVITPRLASNNEEYNYSGGTVFSGKRWNSTPGCATLILAAAMLALCGGLTTALSFYMMYTFQREYYLDIGVLSGFTCLILGLLGLRSRRDKLLPNRNYISGYIVVSILSLLSCAALLSLLCLGPDWGGGALEEMVGGGVTVIGILCLILAVTGAVSSLCCGHPPPDNRVADAREP